jgi:hypothetical protein
MTPDKPVPLNIDFLACKDSNKADKKACKLLTVSIEMGEWDGGDGFPWDIADMTPVEMLVDDERGIREHFSSTKWDKKFVTALSGMTSLLQKGNPGNKIVWFVNAEDGRAEGQERRAGMYNHDFLACKENSCKLLTRSLPEKHALDSLVADVRRDNPSFDTVVPINVEKGFAKQKAITLGVPFTGESQVDVDRFKSETATVPFGVDVPFKKYPNLVKRDVAKFVQKISKVFDFDSVGDVLSEENTLADLEDGEYFHDAEIEAEMDEPDLFGNE